MNSQSALPRSTSTAALLELVRVHGGLIRTSQVQQAGIHTDYLYQLRDEGSLTTISNGLYALSEFWLAPHAELLAVSQAVPQAVIALESALAFHEITTIIPESVVIALPKGSRYPQVSFPRIRVHFFSEATHAIGIHQHSAAIGSIPVFSPEKTLADCFKFRSLLGKEALLEALQLYSSKFPVNVKEVMRFAKACRTETVMAPYVESLLF